MNLDKLKPIKATAEKKITFFLIYIISIVFTYQSLLTAYSSSTYMEQFATASLVGALYALGAAGSVLAFLVLPLFLRRYGNVFISIVLMIFSSFALLIIGLAPTVQITLVAFVLFLTFSPILYLNLDIFSETLTGNDEGNTGSKRGLALTLMSAAALLAPLSLSYITWLSNNNLSIVYYFATSIGLIFITLVLTFFRHFQDPVYHSIKIIPLILKVYQDRNLHSVLSSHFVLQFFFSWMIIYFPLYLATEIGLNWTEIGQIISVGLLAYVIFEYPVGILADKRLGEKEMMAIGFVILALASASISFMAMAGMLGWMAVMFVSRMGASLVEVTTESYFFKQVGGTDADLISIFRLTRPLANLVGALVGSITLLFLPFSLIFIILGFIMVIGIFLTIPIVDTR